MNSTENSNMLIWDAVSKTDPAYTKNYKGPGGFEGTAVAAHWVVMKATEQFGPCGTGWGYTVLVDRYDDGAPILTKDGSQYEPPIVAKTHTLMIEFWYMTSEGKKTVPHYGHTPFIYSNKYGPQTDFEAPKKSLTDALKKALSMLGFTADIHMGLFDDAAYRDSVSDEVAMTEATNKIDEAARQASEYMEWIESNLKLIQTATNMNELKILYKTAIRKLDLRKDEVNKVKFAKAMEVRKADLEKAKGEAA